LTALVPSSCSAKARTWIDFGGSSTGSPLAVAFAPSPRAASDGAQLDHTVIGLFDQALRPRQRFQAAAEFGCELLKRTGGAGRLAGSSLNYGQEVAAAVLQFRQEHLLASLEAAQLVNVSRGADPLRHSIITATDGPGPGLMPAILAIQSPSDAMLDAVFASLWRRLPGRQRGFAIIGLERLKPAEVVAFLVG
jgi:hypothetical protein